MRLLVRCTGRSWRWRFTHRAVQTLREAGVNVPAVRPCDLRHSFITDALLATQDLLFVHLANTLAGAAKALSCRALVVDRLSRRADNSAVCVELLEVVHQIAGKRWEYA